MLIFDEKNDGQTIGINTGQEFEIRLAENPTAGFRWRVTQPGGPVCELLGEKFTAGANAVGRGGVHSWRFRMVGDGTAAVDLAYRRAWESPGPDARTFGLKVTSERLGRA